MDSKWRIIRKGPFVPVPGSPKIVKDVPLALDPVPGDVLLLDRPDDNLDGTFLVLSRVITGKTATLEVKLHTDS
jgi:hypothetical protein